MLMSSDASNPPSRRQIHVLKIKESAQTGTDRTAWYHTGYVIEL